MPQVQTKRRLLSPRAKIILALGIIIFLVVLSFFLPPEGGDSSNVTGDSAVTPTVSITNPLGTLTVNRSVDFAGVHITVTQVQEATAFSNDRKRAGKYTVRVNVHTVNGGQNSIGIEYAAQVRLLLPDGEAIMPKFVTVAPVALPNQKKDGFFDFPVATQVDLSSLMLRLGASTLVAFAT